jgi:RHS repeat-associated protein
LSAIDKDGHVTSYQYDAFGNETNRTDALGNVTSDTYDADGNRLSMTDPLGRTTSYQYDPLNRLIGTTNAIGGISTYIYDGEGRQISTTDPNTNTTTYVYDQRQRLIQTIDAAGGVTSYGYDANDNRIASTNQLGHSTSYSYDSLNRKISTTDPLGGMTRYIYDAVGNRVSSTDPNTNTTTYSYDALNRQVTMTDAFGGTTAYTYATAGGPACCTPTPGSSLIIRSQDPDGNLTFYHYDELNRPVQVVRKNSDTNDVINPADAATTTAYDPVGNVLAITDPVTNTTTYAYDADNRRTNMVNAASDTTRTSYDGDGNVLTVTAPNGNITTTVYDPLNRVITVSDQAGLIRSSTYDPDGNVLTTTDGVGDATRYTYDPLNRQIKETDPLNQTNTTAYDADSNIILETDRDGHTTLYLYDALDRRISVTDPLGNITTTKYDGDGNTVGVTDANGHTTTYGYDALNRRVSTTDVLGETTTYVYDPVGHVIQRDDPMGRITSYSYNALYYLTNRSYQPSGLDDVFTYDDAGRVLTAERASWLDTFSYDGASRLTNTTQNGRILTYTYNISGRVQTNTQPSGRTLSYVYDARNRLVGINDGASSQPIVSYAYDGANRVALRAYRNGTTASYVYDADDRITSLTHSNALDLIAGFNYSYDRDGNRLSAGALDVPSNSQTYTYDPLQRLTNFEIGSLSGPIIPSPSLQETWSLDAVGNWRFEQTNGLPEETDAVNAGNEITNLNGTTLAFDADGDLGQDARYDYVYDEENRLTQVVRLSDMAVVGQYFYDARGRRVMKIAAPAGVSFTNLYFYDDQRIMEEQNPGGQTLVDFTYGNYLDEVLTMDRGGSSYYYHQDALDNPVALSDSSANVSERYTYDPYGTVTVLDAVYNPEPLNSWGTPHSAVTNEWLFTGRQLDEETALYFLRARSYNSQKGRFLQRDPSDNQLGENEYEYVGDNPVNQTDPSGLQQGPLAPGQENIQISAKTVSLTPRLCGAYSWKIAWSVKPAPKKDGAIVQEIIKTTFVWDCDGNLVREKYGHYWEAWSILKGRTTPYRFGSDNWDDNYFSGAWGGKGFSWVSGAATFYTGVNLRDAGFAPGGVTQAGRLWATETDPNLRGGSGTYNHSLQIEWDCCACKTKVFNPTTQFPSRSPDD